MSKIKSVTFFPNGNTAVFDDAGNQMPELQEAWIRLWAEHAKNLGHDVTEIEDIMLPNEKYARFFKIEDGVNWAINDF
jgi:hypothetical protein